MRSLANVAGIGAIAITIGVALLAGCGRSPPGRDAGRATFVGARRCADCHASQYDAWKASQHAASMQVASPGTVLGRFDGSSITSGGVTSTFVRRGDRFIVTTDSTDGTLRDVRIRYTFGVSPLQQYLVDYAGGRLQALTLAWDARPAAAGGQRWFSLQPADIAGHATAQHWTGRAYNWNYMCADCHSTAVRKGYDKAADTYQTTLREINVACEACHGPGSEHVAWARYPRPLRALLWRDDRLPARLTERRGASWVRSAGARTAHRSVPRATDREIETCAQCHARRVHIADGYVAGRPLYDYYIPTLITPDLYYPDGQQREEVYTVGSFLQSKMYAAGVTCSDCHDPHSGRTRRPGNALCAQCHQAAAYDAPAHHHHAPASAGARCVACHMPDTTYMQIDARRDHGIRIPRPDLSLALGVPNACTRCHTNRDARWADELVRRWYPTPASGGGHQRFATAFGADDARAPGAADSLLRVAADTTEPAIARGSALARLAAYPDLDARAFELARAATRDPHPLVRLGALQLSEAAPPRVRAQLASSLLRDPTRAVRQGAAWVLASVQPSLGAEDRAAFAEAAAEFVASQRYNADQPDDRLALGAFYAQLGKYDSAAAEYRAALRLEPRLSRASVYLAAVLRAQGRMPEAIRVLDSARTAQPLDRDVLLSLATYQAESGDSASALGTARVLVRAHPDDARGRTLLEALARRGR